MNFAEYFESTVERCPDKPAIIYRGSSLTYAELRDRVCRAAGALRAFGLAAGDSIAVVAANSASYLELLLACARLGIVMEQYNWRLSPSVTCELLSDSRSRIVFVSPSCIETYRYASDRIDRRLDAIVLGEAPTGYLSYEDMLRTANCLQEFEPVDDRSVLAHLFTSGTTGKPKTVKLTHKGIVSISLVCIGETLWTSEDVFLQVLPLFHISAQAAYNVFILGGTLVLLDSFEPEEYLGAIGAYEVTRIGLVPSMLAILLEDERFSSKACPALKTVIYAGSSMPRETLVKCGEMLNCDLYAFYGMTEMSSVVGILKPCDHEAILARGANCPVPVGKASVGTRLAIVDEHGALCERGREGELVARSDGMMAGYTDEALTLGAIADGWYRTGDMCYQDNEGYYYLVGRKGDMIISGGENLYPSEIEECIRRIGPDVVDVAVAGLPDGKWGQTVAAAVVKRNGSPLAEDDVVAWCKACLASYKKPQKVVFWDDLPRNQSGKVVRGEVAERLAAADAGTDA